MSGCKKEGKAKSGGKAKSRSSRAGLHFPVARFHRMLRKGNYARRIGAAAPIYLAAVLEYLVSEVLELAGNAARDIGKKRITPRHIMLGIRSDSELFRLVPKTIFAYAGNRPQVHCVIVSLPHLKFDPTMIW